MARTVRMTMEDILSRSIDADRVMIDATTEEDIRHHMIEDGQDPDREPAEMTVVIPPQIVRKKLGLTQEAFATALQIPLGTLRDWEQGRTSLDPAAESLLRAVARDPKAVLAAIAG